MRTAFLVQDLASGVMTTVQAFSYRGAAKLYVALYPMEIGSDFRIKLRGTGGWVGYTKTKRGPRQLYSEV